MKALIALYENETPCNFRILGPDHPENTAELARRWPIARFLLLVDGGTTVFETSAIIEQLAAFHAGSVPLIPADAKAAEPVRMLDRVFDSHVMGPVQTVVFDARRPKDHVSVKSRCKNASAIESVAPLGVQRGSKNDEVSIYHGRLLYSMVNGKLLNFREFPSYGDRAFAREHTGRLTSKLWVGGFGSTRRASPIYVFVFAASAVAPLASARRRVISRVLRRSWTR